MFTLQARVDLLPTLRAPAQAREIVKSCLESWDVDARLPLVELLTSELVTNAVRHVGGERPLSVSVSATQHGTVTVSVTDPSMRQPVLRDPADDDTSGRGMHLVDALAQEWGVEQTAVGKSVWARVPLEGQNLARG